MTDDEAVKWAQSNPQDPRAEHVIAKAWAVQHPDDPRSAQVLSAVSKAMQTPPEPTQAPPPNAFNVANNQEKLGQGGGVQHTIDKLAANNDDTFKADPVVKSVMDFMRQGTSPQAMNKIGANALLPGMGAELASGAGALGRLGIGAAMGAAQGAMSPQGDPSLNALGGGALGLLGGSAMEGLGSALGGLKGASQGFVQGSKAVMEEAMEKALQVGTSKGLGDFIKNSLDAKKTAVTGIPSIAASAAIQGGKGLASPVVVNDPRTLSAAMNMVKQ